MKFSDLFVPKIARSDPKVRKNAVAKETNVQVLKKVIKNDPHPEVRQMAEKRIQQLSS